MRLLGLFLLNFFLIVSLVLVAAFAELRWDWKLDSPTLLRLAGALIIGLTVLLGFQSGWRLLFLDARGRWTAFAITLLLTLFYGYQTVRSGSGHFKLKDITELAAVATVIFLFNLGMAVCLILLASRKGGYILSAEYRALARATPRLRWWKTPLGIVGLLVLLVFQAVLLTGLISRLEGT